MKEEIKKGVSYLRKNDPIMRDIIDKIGNCTLQTSPDYYSSLVRTIISQQLSNKASNTIFARLLKKVNDELNPENVLNLSNFQLKSAGISKQKMSYLRDLSTKFLNMEIDTSTFPSLDDEEAITLLTSIRGIGKWSAQMILIYCLNRPNILPLDDLGFRNSLKLNYNLSHSPNKDLIIKISKKWEPYRSIAVWYLWQSINQNG